MDDAHDTPDAPEELPAIEFLSPGRFSIHNPDSEAPEPPAWEPAPFRLGENETIHHFSELEAARAHALALMQQAQRSLCLLSSDLEPWLYHHSSIQQACTQFLLAHPQNRLRILVRDSTRAVKEGHRLLNLSRRLSSNCQIRRINPDQPGSDQAFLLADRDGLLLRSDPGAPSGYAGYTQPRRVRLLQAEFDQAWDVSLSDPNLRSFLL